jgi:hypothetical protein
MIIINSITYYEIENGECKQNIVQDDIDINILIKRVIEERREQHDKQIEKKLKEYYEI